MLQSKIQKTINSNKLINQNDKIIIGVSGGPDSLCLLNILYEIKDKYNLDLYIIHINHNLRGKESLGDQIFVERLAKEKNLPIIIKKVNVLTYKKKYKLTLEEAARNLRHKAFAEIVKQKNIKKIALAHNSSDQVETIIMNYLRGTSIKGLSGMDYKKNFKIFTNNKIINFQIVRPLLDCSKKEILSYLRNKKINFRIDKSNQDLSFTRNRIRHLVLPFFKKNNSDFENNILKKTKILKSLKKEIAIKVKKITKTAKINKGTIEFSLKEWFSLDEFYKRESILFLINSIYQLKDIGAVHLDEAVSLLEESKTGSYKVLPHNLVIYKDYDKLIISHKNILFDKKLIARKKLNINSKIEIKEINAEFSLKTVHKIDKSNLDKIFVDYDKTGGAIYLRSRKKGDYFQPVGMKGKVKIQDFLVNNKISKIIRDKIPILVDKYDRIIWVAGLRQDKRFIINNKSKNIIQIKFLKK